MSPYTLALHGGAGALSAARVPPDRVEEMRIDLERALEQGVRVLARGGSAIDAVVASVSVLEDSRVFNAGRGAVLRRDGSVCMDASVMFGEARQAGAVSLVRTPRNPVQLARAVLDRGREVLLAGSDADRLATELGLATEPPQYFVTDYRVQQLARLADRTRMELDHDPAEGRDSTREDGTEEGQTVGAVALDAHGHLAAATSTGGMTNAEVSRVGDSPILGAGTWASDETCAVSATGAGEFFIRSAFAHSVHARLAWAGENLDGATRQALDEVVRMGGHGGCVAIDHEGNVTTPFTTLAMPRAYRLCSGERQVLVLEPMFGRTPLKP